MNITTDELCVGTPFDFQIIYNYIKNLQYSTVPNYDYIRKVLKKIATEEHINLDSKFEWQENSLKTTKKPTKK